ncbi:MAG: hypothetical protein ACT6RL_22290 [Neoaquamicrobium sediminum]|uniref:hypothetical protein n=1 Tax=Neoaquamicrobium sediminum TaxID=1849104 RepID=UPI0040382042
MPNTAGTEIIVGVENQGSSALGSALALPRPASFTPAVNVAWIGSVMYREQLRLLPNATANELVVFESAMPTGSRQIQVAGQPVSAYSVDDEGSSLRIT